MNSICVTQIMNKASTENSATSDIVLCSVR